MWLLRIFVYFTCLSKVPCTRRNSAESSLLLSKPSKMTTELTFENILQLHVLVHSADARVVAGTLINHTHIHNFFLTATHIRLQHTRDCNTHATKTWPQHTDVCNTHITMCLYVLVHSCLYVLVHRTYSWRRRYVAKAHIHIWLQHTYVCNTLMTAAHVWLQHIFDCNIKMTATHGWV